MTALELYQLYLALKLHFTSDKFDVRRTYKIPISTKQFQTKGAIKYALQRLIRKHTRVQCVEFLVANFVAGDKNGGGVCGEGERGDLQWQKRNQKLSYLYEQDLRILQRQSNNPRVASLWEGSGEHPILLKSFFGKTCSLETLAILDKLFSFRSILDGTLVQDPAWKETSKLLYKYSMFVPIKPDTYHAITRRIFAE